MTAVGPRLAASALAGIVFAASPKGSGGGVKRARELVAAPELWPAAAAACTSEALGQRLSWAARLDVRQRESVARVMSGALDRLVAR